MKKDKQKIKTDARIQDALSRKPVKAQKIADQKAKDLQKAGK